VRIGLRRRSGRGLSAGGDSHDCEPLL
jgi:hypothetical protein